MKFLLTTSPNTDAPPAPPSPEFMQEMGRFVEEQTKAGVLLATGGLLPVSKGGARVRSSGGKFSVVDGPYAESKELIAGFAMIEVPTREAAIEASRKFFKIAGDGEGEIRQIMG